MEKNKKENVDMPIWNFICDECGEHDERMFVHSDVIEKQLCKSCGGFMNKLPSMINFKLVYNNKTDLCDWSGNKSRYWDSYKQQKAEGKSVRIPEEDGESRTK